MFEKVTSTLKKKCRWFDIFIEEAEATPILFKNNRLYSITKKQNSGFSVRVNVDGKTGFCYSNNIDAIEETAEHALVLAKYGEKDTFELPSPVTSGKVLEPFCDEDDLKAFSVDDEIAKGKTVIDVLRNEYPDLDVQLHISSGITTQRLLNSNAVNISDSKKYYSAYLSVTNVDGNGTRTEIGESLSSFEPQNIDGLAAKILEKLAWSRSLADLSSGKVPVMLTPKAFSSLLGILLAGCTAKAHYKRISPFSGRLGDKFFNEKLTIIDDPFLKDSIYSFWFDDEGVAAQKTSLIVEGFIKDVISDLKYSDLLSMPPSGNSSRGYSSQPSASFSNIVVHQGSAGQQDLLSSLPAKGILIDQFIGLGQSNTLTGDFSANLDLAFLIEDGKIVGRLKDCMVSDNLFSLLAGSIECSSERECMGNALLPYLLFEHVNFTKK